MSPLRALLDTCTFLWLLTDAKELSVVARDIVKDPECEVFLSVASVWEIATKYQLKKLPLPAPPARYIPKCRERLGIDSLPIEEAAALAQSQLPPLHRDPFDRILIAQAIVHGLTILTPDEHIRKYPVVTMW